MLELFILMLLTSKKYKISKYLKGYDIVCGTEIFFRSGLLHMTVYSETVEKSQQVANARIAKNHSRHLIKPRGSFNTRVSITFDPIGCKNRKKIVKTNNCYHY